jgi:hypothetical protein
VPILPEIAQSKFLRRASGTRVIFLHYPHRKIGRVNDREHVVSAKEFREYADECLGWAKTAKSDKERRTFLQMAQAWLEAADLLETKPPAADLPIKPGSSAPLSGDAT